MTGNANQNGSSGPNTGHGSDSDFDNLSEYEMGALKAAEKRFLSQKDEEHEYSFLPALEQKQIRGTYFTCFANVPDGRVPPELRHLPVLLRSEKNRFKYLCDVIMRYWQPELDLVVETLVMLETHSEHEETQMQAESFGLGYQRDSYRVGYLPGPNAPIFASKELIVELINLVARSLIKLEPQHRNFEFDPEEIPKRLRSVQVK